MESLKREGVERVFGYAGATICPAVDALAAASIAYTWSAPNRTPDTWPPATPA